MVKPGGTGRPRLAISARLAPLPPSKSRRPALPSALPSPNVKTHLPDCTAPAADFPAGLLPAPFAHGLGAGLPARLVTAWRALADGAVLALVDDFDFVAVFL